MPACGITHAAHSAVIKTPDFPQDPLSPPCRWKGNTHVEISPPLHQGRKTIFLDRLNETMTAVSNGERKKKERQMERKQRWTENEGEGVQKGEKSSHAIALSPDVTASNDNPAFRSRWKHWFNISPHLLNPPYQCRCDPETALWLHRASRRENDGGNIKHKRVGCNNRHSLLFFSLVFFFHFCFPEAIRHHARISMHQHLVPDK